MQPRDQQYSYGQNLSIEHDFKVLSTRALIHSVGQTNWKSLNRPEYLNSYATETDDVNKQETKILLRMK